MSRLSPTALWRHLTHGLRVLIDRRAADRDLADEVEHYLAQAAAAHRARGVSAEQALRAARMEVGNHTVVREQVRDGGWEHAVSTVLSDLGYAARRLRRDPGFALVIVLTLALGVGASSAIFSAVHPMLFAPLPYPEAGQILRVSDRGADGSPIDVTFGTFRELITRGRSLAAAAVVKPWQPTVTGGAEPERLAGQRVSAGYFRVLGVPPVLGRDFDAAEDQPRGPRVVILGHGLWRRRFGGDAAIVGRTVRLDDNPHTVVGVMPANFENVLSPGVEAWAPLQYGESLAPDSREWGHHLRMVVRARPGVSRERAEREMNAIAGAPLPEFARVPWASLAHGLSVSSLRDDVTRGVRPALLAVLGAVLLLLAIACVNVTNLLLARGAQRRAEFAMRAALGAGHGRIVRQLLTESLLLAVLGGALGLVVAEAGVRALVALSPPGLPRPDAIRLDAAVFGFALGVSTIIGLVVGVVPARQASRAGERGGMRAALQQGSRRTAGDHGRARRALVVTEVALALVLLVGAGLLLRSLQRLFAVEVGFDDRGVLTMQIQSAGRRLDADSVRLRFFEQSLEAVRRVPGVEAAALTSQLPLSGDLDIYGVRFEGDDPADVGGAALRYAVTPGWFAAMRIPLRRGRALGDEDRRGAPRAAVINEAMAARRFPNADPIGQRLKLGTDDGTWFTVVGVAADVKQASLGLGAPDAVYITPWQWHWADAVMSLVVRTSADPAALAARAKAAVWSVDPNQPIVRVATMRTLVERSAAERRFALTLFEAFALAALALAAVGIYGVLAGSVTERQREIGVRAALGATRGDILGLVVRQGMTLTALGAALGIGGAVAASRALTTLLFGVSRLDPVTYGSVVLLLVTVSTLACALPAWRAARVDPSVALRAE